jgi:starch phosphorylase
LIHDPDLEIPPRVFIFAAKAAPGYDMAKLIIKAINAVGSRINSDPRVKDKLKVVFLPNYRVSLAQRIVPAADLSEQISTAGKEASGTGNMKLALNGAVTIGTLDGANVEIREEVGDENIFIFGHTVDEVREIFLKGHNPATYCNANPELAAVIDWLGTDFFTESEGRDILSPLRDNLLYHDPYLCLADFASYCQAQDEVSKAFLDKPRWAKMAVLNTARVGKFSSDRTILEYARDIWNLQPVRVS